MISDNVLNNIDDENITDIYFSNEPVVNNVHKSINANISNNFCTSDILSDVLDDYKMNTTIDIIDGLIKDIDTSKFEMLLTYLYIFINLTILSYYRFLKIF